uniref:Uncharacterized protein n=1 Tax=Glossina austeni TaxID=7395 RepID=A0A1A9ULS4_GLOAU
MYEAAYLSAQAKTMTAQTQKKMRYRYQMPYNETRIHTYYAKANVLQSFGPFLVKSKPYFIKWCNVCACNCAIYHFNVVIDDCAARKNSCKVSQHGNLQTEYTQGHSVAKSLIFDMFCGLLKIS